MLLLVLGVSGRRGLLLLLQRNCLVFEWGRRMVMLFPGRAPVLTWAAARGKSKRFGTRFTELNTRVGLSLRQ